MAATQDAGTQADQVTQGAGPVRSRASGSRDTMGALASPPPAAFSPGGSHYSAHRGSPRERLWSSTLHAPATRSHWLEGHEGTQRPGEPMSACVGVTVGLSWLPDTRDPPGGQDFRGQRIILQPPPFSHLLPSVLLFLSRFWGIQRHFPFVLTGNREERPGV